MAVNGGCTRKLRCLQAENAQGATREQQQGQKRASSGSVMHRSAHLLLCVAEDNCLCDGQCIVEIAEGVKFPLLLLHCHKELLDALPGIKHKLRTYDIISVHTIRADPAGPLQPTPRILMGEACTDLESQMAILRARSHNRKSLQIWLKKIAQAAGSTTLFQAFQQLIPMV